MPKQKHSSSFINKRSFASLALGLLLIAGTFVSYQPLQKALAAASCSTITECNQKIAENNNAVAQLQAQATSYQDAINHLQAQIDQLQGSIAANQSRQADLEQQIAQKQADITRERGYLAEDIRTMYVSGQMTTIEELATSNNLSDYVDKQAYRNAVQGKIQDTLTQIATLQAQLKSQKEQVQALIAQEQTQQAQVVAARNQQSAMLSYNQSQQDSFNQQTADNKKKLDQLIAAQLLANRSRGNGALLAGATSYPYANAGFGMSTAPGCVDNDGPDAWGYCTRQCVSYAAWAVAHSGRQAPMYYGNAKDWVYHALVNNVPVYSFNNIDGYGGVQIGTPQPGDVAISTAGTWGHAMYVEAVNGTQVYVSQYNASLTGEFSHQWRDGSNYYFLRFP